MATLYGSMAGAKTTGLVGHKEMQAQLAHIGGGVIRVFLDKDGGYEVYLADDEGNNGFVLVRGNVNGRTVEDAGGKPINVSKLAETLEPIVVKNRGPVHKSPTQPVQRAAPKKSPPPKKATTSTTKRRQVPGGPQTSAGQQQQAQPGNGAKKTATKLDLGKFSVGDKVTLRENPDASITKKGIKVGHKGTIEKIREKSPLGPQIVVKWDRKGAAVVFPDQGDRITPARS